MFLKTDMVNLSFAKTVLKLTISFALTIMFIFNIVFTSPFAKISPWCSIGLKSEKGEIAMFLDGSYKEKSI